MSNLMKCVVVLLTFGGVFAIVGVMGIHEMAYWDEHGVVTKGVVTRHYEREDCQRDSSGNTSCLTVFVLEYRYQTQSDRSLSGSDTVSEELWQAHPVDAEVSLMYSALVPSETTVSFLHDSETTRLLFQLSLFGGCVLILLSLLLCLRGYMKGAGTKEAQ